MKSQILFFFFIFYPTLFAASGDIKKIPTFTQTQVEGPVCNIEKDVLPGNGILKSKYMCF